MKLKLTLILSLMICSLDANQVCMRSKQYSSVVRSKKIDQPVYRNGSVEDELELIDIEVDEEINPESLIPLWARLANKMAAPFFVLYNNVTKWLNAKEESARLKKTKYMKRF